MAQVDPRDMLNNFCFHVYAQKSLILLIVGMGQYEKMNTTTDFGGQMYPHCWCTSRISYLRRFSYGSEQI